MQRTEHLAAQLEINEKKVVVGCAVWRRGQLFIEVKSARIAQNDKLVIHVKGQGDDIRRA